MAQTSPASPAHMANALRAWAQFPDEYAKLRAEQKKVRAAFDESLRWDSPSRMAGRIAFADGSTALVRTGPFLRFPQLAIHLDREVNDKLTLKRQAHMNPVFGLGDRADADLLGHLVGISGGGKASDVAGYDISVADTATPTSPSSPSGARTVGASLPVTHRPRSTETAGTYVITIRPTPIIRMNGTTARIRYVIGLLKSVLATKRFSPTGGVR